MSERYVLQKAADVRRERIRHIVEGRAAIGMEDDERFVALIHLGPARQEREAPERESPGDYVSFLP